MNSKISVVIPTYRRPELLRRCLASVQSQTFQDFDVLIVDNDGKDAKVSNTVSQHNNQRFKYLCELTPGTSAARNTGIKEANSDLVIFLDDDDEVEVNFLRHMYDFMTHDNQSEVSFSWCGVIKYFENPKNHTIEKKNFLIKPRDLDDMSFIMKIGTGCGLCVRKSHLLEVGGFDESFKLSEDRDLVFKLIKRGGKFRPLNKFLYKRHYHSGERLSQSLNALEEVKYHYKLYHQHRKFITQHPVLQIRLLDLIAYHYYQGGKHLRAVEVASQAWKTQFYRIRGARRLLLYWLKLFFSFSKEKLVFKTSSQYWHDRYEAGKNSGVGSYGLFAKFKADVLNDFVKKNDINTVIEFGCGDGNQLHLAHYKQYTGFDISEKALELCHLQFSADSSKKFKLMHEYRQEKYELSLSLDVIYHLVENEVFASYMTNLFAAATRHVIIYSSNHDDVAPSDSKHVRHREFTKWIDKNITGWKMTDKIPNKYPYKGNYKTGSFADFFIYGKTAE